MASDERSLDVTYRRMIARNPAAIVELSLGLPEGAVVDAVLLNADLPPAYVVESDAVVLASAPGTLFGHQQLVLHLEVQARPEPAFGLRMATYAVRLAQAFPDARIEQVVLAVAPAADRIVPYWQSGGLFVRWTHRSLGELDGMAWAHRLPVLAAGASAADEEQLLRAVQNEIARLPPETALAELIDAVLIAGHHSAARAAKLRAIKELPMSNDQLLYSSVLAPAVEAREHAAEARGEARGKALAEARTLISILERRLGALGAEREAVIAGATADQLDALLGAVLDVTSFAEVDALLA